MTKLSKKGTYGSPNAAIKLQGQIRNLLNADIVVLAGKTYSTFETSGDLAWHGADKPTRLTTVGRLNGLFMLMEPTTKVGEPEIAQICEALPIKERHDAERTIWCETHSKKSSCYAIVSKTAAIIAHIMHCNLENLLVPTFTIRMGEQRNVHVGFIPARLLFECLEIEK